MGKLDNICSAPHIHLVSMYNVMPCVGIHITTNKTVSTGDERKRFYQRARGRKKNEKRREPYHTLAQYLAVTFGYDIFVCVDCVSNSRMRLHIYIVCLCVCKWLWLIRIRAEKSEKHTTHIRNTEIAAAHSAQPDWVGLDVVCVCVRARFFSCGRNR